MNDPNARNPYSPPATSEPGGGGYQFAQPPQDAFTEMHRGGKVLTMGILGLAVCFVFGIVAWSMGATDLRKMDEGVMDRSGMGLTRAGKILGTVGTFVGGLTQILYAIGTLANA